MRRLFVFAALAACLRAQPTMHLTLADAQKLAIQNNPRFTSARYTAAATHQVPQEYRANYQPTVFGSLTGVGADNGSRLAAGGLNNPVVYNRVGSGLTVSQMITDFGRTSSLVSSAEFRAAAQDQATETTRADILLETSRAYFAILRSQAVLKVANQTVSARQAVADQITALAESKLKSQLDVSFANVNLADARLLQAQAQNDVKAAQADLGAVLGMSGEARFDVAEERMPEPLPDRIDGLLAEGVRNRPELKDLRLEQTAEERFAKAEHRLYFPTLGVVGTAGFVPSGAAPVPGQYGAVGLNVNIPVFNGGLFKARQTEAELRAKATAENANDLQNRIVRDIRVAFLNATTAYDRVGLTAQLLKQAQLALELAQNRYDLGLGTIVELSQAQLGLTSAQIGNANAIYDYQTRRVVVDYQTGVLR